VALLLLPTALTGKAPLSTSQQVCLLDKSAAQEYVHIETSSQKGARDDSCLNRYFRRYYSCRNGHNDFCNLSRDGGNSSTPIGSVTEVEKKARG